jgi:hypothetical protein
VLGSIVQRAPEGVLPDLGTEKETGLVVEAGVESSVGLKRSTSRSHRRIRR